MKVEWDERHQDHMVKFKVRIDGIPYSYEYLAAGRSYEELAKLAIADISEKRNAPEE